MARTRAGASVLKEVAVQFDTLSDLITFGGVVGSKYSTAGFTTKGDGGGIAYLLKTLIDYGATPDERRDHTSGSNVLVLQEPQTGVPIEALGAIGDGVTNDSAALLASFGIRTTVLFGSKVYAFSTPVVQTKNYSVTWKGIDSELLYTGAHAEYSIQINQNATMTIDIQGMTLNGNQLCNSVLNVFNNTSNATAGILLITDSTLKNNRRIDTFLGGDCLYVRGAFSNVVLKNCTIKDCELGTGMGTSGVVGITGIVGNGYSDTSYIRRFTLTGCTISNVYSEDASYTSDQDGIKFFAPFIGATTRKVDSILVVDGNTRFENCWGRSIKTQARTTIVRDSTFERNAGNSTGVGNVEIDSQTGNLVVSSCSFNYKNGQNPGACTRAISGNIGNRDGMIVKDCEVYLDGSTVLDSFAQTFPSGAPLSTHIISGNRIYGFMNKLVDFLCDGITNILKVTDNYVEEILDDLTLGRSLIYVRTSGTGTISAQVTANDNMYGGLQNVAICRDSIPDVSMRALLSCSGNVGFLDDANAAYNEAGQKTNQVTKTGRIAPKNDPSGLEPTIRGYHEILSKDLAAGATHVFDVRNLYTAFIIFNAAYNNQSYAMFSSGPTSNIVVSKGTATEVGNATQPVTGIFRIWTSGTGKISVTNTDASIRTVTLWVLSAA